MLLIVTLLLAGCAADEALDAAERPVMIRAVIRAGSDTQTALVQWLSPESGMAEPAEGSLQVIHQGQWVSWTRNGAVYESPPDAAVIGYSETGSVRFVSAHGSAEGTFETPPELIVSVISPQSFSADPDNPGSTAFSALWSPLPGCEYVAILEEPGEEEPLIPFPSQGGWFASRFSGPFTANAISLRQDDFLRYGEHRLRIIAIGSFYRDLHFYSPQAADGSLLPALSNVTGGYGVITGVSETEITLNVQP
jgi:hypothetical protein